MISGWIPSHVRPVLLGLVGLMLAASALTTHAQWVWESADSTHAVPASTTDTTPSTPIDAGRVDEFALQITGRLTGAGTSAVTYTIERSVTGTLWMTAFALPVTASGTNWVTAMTNVTAQAYPFWRISSRGNANAAAWTNAAVVVGHKRRVRKYNP